MSHIQALAANDFNANAGNVPNIFATTLAAQQPLGFDNSYSASDVEKRIKSFYDITNDTDLLSKWQFANTVSKYARLNRLIEGPKAGNENCQLKQLADALGIDLPRLQELLESTGPKFVDGRKLYNADAVAYFLFDKYAPSQDTMGLMAYLKMVLPGNPDLKFEDLPPRILLKNYLSLASKLERFSIHDIDPDSDTSISRVFNMDAINYFHSYEETALKARNALKTSNDFLEKSENMHAADKARLGYLGSTVNELQKAINYFETAQHYLRVSMEMYLKKGVTGKQQQELRDLWNGINSIIINSKSIKRRLLDHNRQPPEVLSIKQK